MHYRLTEEGEGGGGCYYVHFSLRTSSIRSLLWKRKLTYIDWQRKPTQDMKQLKQNQSTQNNKNKKKHTRSRMFFLAIPTRRCLKLINKSAFEHSNLECFKKP